MSEPKGRFDEWGAWHPYANPVPENVIGAFEPGHFERVAEQQRRAAAEVSFAEQRRKAPRAPQSNGDAPLTPERTITPLLDDSTARRLLARWRKTRP